VIDFPKAHRFESIHVVYDGINGQLPNLDLVNTAVSIASGQMGIGANIQRMWSHDDKYEDRLRTIFRSMVNQGVGLGTGPHSSFIPYHVDAITLQAVGEGWQDEMAFGRTIESLFRSLNNLLEHFHQSFFFYLLMHPKRFVSIGTYLPSVMLLAFNFIITSTALWVQSGKEEQRPEDASGIEKDKKTPAKPAVKERALVLPLMFVISVHALGAIPLYLFNHSSETVRLYSQRLRKREHTADMTLFAIEHRQNLHKLRPD
jgi:glycosylphosphatidylinositol transamidase